MIFQNSIEFTHTAGMLAAAIRYRANKTGLWKSRYRAGTVSGSYNAQPAP
jgi:hypothetical protein